MDYESGSKPNTNFSHKKYDSFSALTSGLEDVAFQPHSLATQFKKKNDRLADHVGVTFRRMGLKIGKAMRKLVQPVLAVPIMPDSESKAHDAEIIVFTETFKIANQDIREFKDANQQSYNLYK